MLKAESFWVVRIKAKFGDSPDWNWLFWELFNYIVLGLWQGVFILVFLYLLKVCEIFINLALKILLVVWVIGRYILLRTTVQFLIVLIRFLGKLFVGFSHNSFDFFLFIKLEKGWFSLSQQCFLCKNVCFICFTLLLWIRQITSPLIYSVSWNQILRGVHTLVNWKYRGVFLALVAAYVRIRERTFLIWVMLRSLSGTVTSLCLSIFGVECWMGCIGSW